MSARTILKHVYENGGMTEYQYERIDRVLKERERPHGEWIIRRDKQGTHIYSVCSRCNVAHLDTDFPNFCENCGSDNRKRGEEENKEAYLPFDLSEWKDEDNGGCQENVIDTDDFINEIGADLNGF